MVDPASTSHPEGSPATTRRSFLGATALAGTTLPATGAARTDTNDVPSRARTEWSEPIRLGHGELRTFTTVTPAGDPVSHGVSLDRDALTGLPTGEELAARGRSDDPGDKYGSHGEAVEIHHAWSQEFFVPIPGTDATPFTFLGFNWNPTGHPPPNVYDCPHFDVHFHTRTMDAVDAIEGLAPADYELPETRLPEGYARAPEPTLDGAHAVVTDMGEHLVDPASPALTGTGPFEHTLIWGTDDVDGDGLGELTFVEPMLTRKFLQDVTDSTQYEIAQPDTYPTDGAYPTAYGVRDRPDRDAITITIEDFTAAE